MRLSRRLLAVLLVSGTAAFLACSSDSGSDDDGTTGGNDGGASADTSSFGDVFVFGDAATANDAQAVPDAGPVLELRLRAPMSTAHVTTAHPTLHWFMPASTTSAMLDLCLDRACANPIGSAISVTGDSYHVTAGLPIGVVYWRLRSAATTTPVWQFYVPAANDAGATIDDSWGTTLDLDGDGYADIAVGADTAENGIGTVSIYRGGSGALGAAAIVLHGPEGPDPNGYFGQSVASAGDVNGDGYDDLVVGAPGTSEPNAGFAYVYLGSATGVHASPDRSIVGPISTSVLGGIDTTYGRFGMQVVGLGDIDGDGYGDIAVGNDETNDGDSKDTQYTGSIYVFRGGPTGIGAAASLVLQAPDGTASQFGERVIAAGDVNGDGYADMLASSEGIGYGYLYLGSAYGFPATPSAKLSDVPPGSPRGSFGYRLSGGTDLNGDGYADLLVGSRGQVGFYVFTGGASGVAATPTVFALPAMSSPFQRSFANAGDIDGDGFADVVAFECADCTVSPLIDIYGGSPMGLKTTPILTKAATPNDGGPTPSYPPNALWATGDVNGDHLADFALTVPSLERGAVYSGTTGSTLAAPQSLQTDGGQSDFGIGVGTAN